MPKVKSSPKSKHEFEISYKNYEYLLQFLSDRAKIIGKKYTRLSPKAQRQLSRAIKRARHLGLLPFKAKI